MKDKMKFNEGEDGILMKEKWEFNNFIDDGRLVCWGWPNFSNPN